MMGATPGLAAQPVHAQQRTTRGQLNTARLALNVREYTIAELAEHIQSRHPDRALDMARLVERLVQLGQIEIVGQTLGLTDAGLAAVKQLEGYIAVAARKTNPSQHSAAQRRESVLDPHVADLQALTRSKLHPAASQADLAVPPPRPGADDGLELPSRIGNRLHYRSGRICDMQGDTLQPPHDLVVYQPSRTGANAATRLAFPEKLFAR